MFTGSALMIGLQIWDVSGRSGPPVIAELLSVLASVGGVMLLGLVSVVTEWSTGAVPVKNIGMRPSSALAFVVLLAQAAATPATFQTKARFSTGRTVLNLTSAVATIEPRLGAPGYRWLRVHFYAFPLTPADVAAAIKGNIAPLDRRWKSKAANPAEYNVSNAVLQFGVDKDGKVWQIDLSVPGHACTIASSDVEAKALLQDYLFDGLRLRLRTKGAHPCEKFAWAVDVAVPVFEVGVSGR